MKDKGQQKEALVQIKDCTHVTAKCSGAILDWSLRKKGFSSAIKDIGKMGTF